MRLRSALLFAAVVGFAPAVRADVKPHPLFTDNMVLQRDTTCPVWGTADPEEKVEVTLKREGKANPGVTSVSTTADEKGNWKVGVASLKPGTGYTLTIKGKNTITLKNVAVGEVWVCSGQSNMEMTVDRCYNPLVVKTGSANPDLRLFTVKRRTATAPVTDPDDLGHLTTWDVSGPDTVGGFSAVAYHFGSYLQQNLKVPVGLIHSSWGGTPAQAWTSTGALDDVDELKHYADAARTAVKAKQPVNPGTPASLYNGMIHPLLPFAIKGAIWYQGESNAGKAYEYRTLFQTMIKDWRAKWGYDFPFLCVQLAPWHGNDADGVTWAELREAQLLATRELKDVGMAVITDAGDLFDIHPKDKVTPGSRLGMYANGMVYGKDIVYSGPVYKDVEFDGDKAVVTFDHVGGGLVARYQTLNGFTICGKDRVFHPATAELKGDTVVVHSDKVAEPVAVRFGWKNYPVVNLYNRNKGGKGIALPATPFRTDDFPLTTAPPKEEGKRKK